jgi:hypothetical protein
MNNCDPTLELTEEEIEELKKMAKEHSLFPPAVLAHALWKKRHKKCLDEELEKLPKK